MTRTKKCEDNLWEWDDDIRNEMDDIWKAMKKAPQTEEPWDYDHKLNELKWQINDINKYPVDNDGDLRQQK